MEIKKGSLSIGFLVIAIILIVVMGAFMYMQKTEADRQIAELENNASKLQETINDLQGKIDSVSDIVSDIENAEIPKASTNISEKEQETINYFDGIWTTYNGEKLLAIDSGKRFCDINKTNNSKEYGTYTVKEETSSSVPTITLTYTSGKVLELLLVQGSANFLESNDREVQYVEYEGYYYGIGDYDDGIFEDAESIQSPNMTENEMKIISNYFCNVWITPNGEKELVVALGIFCDINTSNNSKEYGTYTFEDGTEPKITLTYTSGKILTLKLTQGGTSYLISNDGKVQYVNCYAYYFGASEGDEGIFNK